MLQQTQVERVIPFYKKFIKEFSTAKKLAQAPLSAVLKSWQGLGYNRRAKQLHQAAKEFPRFNLGIQNVRLNLEKLEELPGVGPYTARAIVAFALNQDVIMVETNIRTAVMHHFFPKKKPSVAKAVEDKKVSDKEIEKILVQVLPKGRARDWYFALMDYGAYLKKSGIKLNAKHANYTKQKKFAGSTREARGAILRALAFSRGSTSRKILNLLGPSRRAQLRVALTALQSEGLISKTGRSYTLAN
ncbi:MAG: A/G-specific adenine glycosylase [Candidatus Kaiserbacteria bacterium]|nr:A/G-specific adenine glycosylase [Candidatus Kaiserbacteria bacterium]